MKPYPSGSSTITPKERCYVFNSFIAGVIRNSSLLILILWFGFTVVTAAIDTAKSFWYHPSVARFVAALKADIDDICASDVDLNGQSTPSSRDLVKMQKEETRARRALAKELRHRKAFATRIKAFHQFDRKT